MGCFGSSNANSGILIMYNGNLIELKDQDYNFSRLIDLVNQRTEKESSILSLSTSGNAFRIRDDKDLRSLKIARSSGGRILLIVAPEALLDIFNITLVSDKELDKGFEAVSVKLKSLLNVIAGFDKIFYRFVQSLSVLFVRSCNIMTTITSLLVLMTPYLQELRSDPPYIIITEQRKSLMPQDIREILTLWELLLTNLEKIEEHLATLDNNLTFLLSGRAKNRLEIIKGKTKVNFKNFRIAENNVKVHKSLENVRDMQQKIQCFKDSVMQGINVTGDRRVQIIKRITLIGEASVIESPHQMSWVLGLGDYVIIPDAIRFY